MSPMIILIYSYLRAIIFRSTTLIFSILGYASTIFDDILNNFDLAAALGVQWYTIPAVTFVVGVLWSGCAVYIEQYRLVQTLQEQTREFKEKLRVVRVDGDLVDGLCFDFSVRSPSIDTIESKKPGIITEQTRYDRLNRIFTNRKRQVREIMEVRQALEKDRNDKIQNILDGIAEEKQKPDFRFPYPFLNLWFSIKNDGVNDATILSVECEGLHENLLHLEFRTVRVLDHQKQEPRFPLTIKPGRQFVLLIWCKGTLGTGKVEDFAQLLPYLDTTENHANLNLSINVRYIDVNGETQVIRRVREISLQTMAAAYVQHWKREGFDELIRIATPIAQTQASQ